ncbi:MAG: 2-amino-4-hydroxy-6-hydroxymethyldihydropteridine diphosphokinase [Phocaeicola sp.]
MVTVYLSLGSNLGEKEAYLHRAVADIEKRVGKITSLSAFYVTEAWGYHSENNYLNAACAVQTVLEPFELLTVTQSIEKDMGRLSKSCLGVYTDRVIDIDILLYEDCVLNTPELTIPHPLMAERLFVLEPLAEIAPNFIHPLLGKSMTELLSLPIIKD